MTEPGDSGRGRLAPVVASGLAVLAMLAAVAVLLGGGLLGGNGVDPVAGSSAAASASADPVPTTSGPTTPDPTTPGPTTPAPVDAKPWRLVRVGDPVTVTAPFTDPGTNDTHRCDIAWDDGTAFSGPARNHECRATHAYRHAGMFTVKTVVTDDDGGSAEAPGLLVVVYDPAAGPARGSGRIRSGRFDFTASYPPAATGPVGSVGVDLPARLDLRDHQRLEWLVVTPDGKVAIKGTAGRLGFLLYWYPGPQRFRLVVWEGAPVPDGVPALYDNRPGTPFDLDGADPEPVS